MTGGKSISGAEPSMSADELHVCFNVADSIILKNVRKRR